MREALPGKLVRPAGKVPEPLGREPQLKGAEAAPGRAERHARQGGQLLGVGVDEVGEAEHAVAALAGGGAAPGGEGPSGGVDGGIDIVRVG